MTASPPALDEKKDSLQVPIAKESTESIKSRGNWGNRWEFLLSCVGLSVGIGNVWRFPYLAYSNGGGAFLIPYLIMLFLAGKPMYFMELAFGQFAGVGPMSAFTCAPICKGVGVAMVAVCIVICVYYNIIMSYTIYYMAAVFQSVVPWSVCDPSWTNCQVRQANQTTLNGSQTPSQLYWERSVLDLTEGIENLGGIKWDLALCLLLSWIIVIFCLLKGIKTSGKVVYFAATFPYVILITLLITGLTQPGAIDGVLYFITPDWEKLLTIKVWQAAANQMFFSLSVAMGALIMYSSYNDFHHNVFRDAMVVSVMDTVTSIISGMVIFSVLGAMAHDLGGGATVEDVVAAGPGLAFVAYPEALSRLPIPQLWSVLFFLMLFILGLDSEFALLENVLTSICDEIPILRKRKMWVCVGAGVVCYILGLPCVTRGGQYVLELMDTYGGGVAIVFIAMSECIALMWVYGYNEFCNDIYYMMNTKMGIYWRITWQFTSPLVLAFIFIYALIEHKPLTYGEHYKYPAWADAIGWCLALFSMGQVPLWAIIMILRQPGPSLLQKVKQSLRPSISWGPSDPQKREEWRADKDKKFQMTSVSSVAVINKDHNGDVGTDNPAFTDKV